jgi:2-polyprenyl-6-hydroxyphenyl methylase/3-demethylubiquinone-9 3-methyltransferase
MEAASLKTSQGEPRQTVDPAEVARFNDIAAEWWDANGKFRPLHRQGPARLTFIREALVKHFALPPSPGLRCLAGLSVLDVGCGGGLICEPLARLGASVTGIDPGTEAIAVASRHAAAQGLSIDYRVATAEQVAADGARFDAVLCLEVIEHVPDVASLLSTLAKLLRPGGLLIVSTLNRTLKSYALAIVAAEYVLSWLPRGTHDWRRFVTPDELKAHLVSVGLSDPRFSGIVYDVLHDDWRISSDCGVNYMATATLGA